MGPATTGGAPIRLRTNLTRAVAVVAATAALATAALTATAPSAVAEAVEDLQGCNDNYLAPNDDASTGVLDLPFTVNFYGFGYDSVFVDNNGNVTFDAPSSEFTPFGLKSTSRAIVAPFFADVDTRGTGSGRTEFGETTWQGHRAFCVLWPDVGYYPTQTDKLNSFQLLLVQREDRGNSDFDIIFNYDAISWETGGASGGSGGVGGSSARVGFSGGQGTDATSYELPGSGVPGAFLDTNTSSGLVHNSRGSDVTGRYVYEIRNGSPKYILRSPTEMFGQSNQFGFASDPVNTATGNFTFTNADLPMPSAPLLDWGRTYNSLDTSDGLLGRGWFATHTSAMTALPDGDLTYRHSDSRIFTFAATDTGWTLPADLRAELTSDGNGWTMTFHSGVTADFDGSGRLASVGADGRTASYHYDGTGALTRVSADTGEELTLEYDPVLPGRVQAVTASDGRSVQYGYDPTGNLTTVTDATGATTQYTLTGTAQVQTVTDADGRVMVTNTYDVDGRVARQDLPNGNSLTFGYDDITGTTTVTEDDGAAMVFAHDRDGRPIQIQGPDGTTASRAWDAGGNLVGATQRGGAELDQSVNDRGDLVSSSYAGATTTWIYDDQHRVTAETDALGNTTRYTYTGTDRLPTTMVDPLGGTTNYIVTDGRITSVTDPDGVTMSYTYDDNGRLVSTRSPTGGTTMYEYDDAGRLTSTTDPLGGVSATSYDAAGRVTSRTDPAGALTQHEYSRAGLLTSTTDPAGATQTYAHDEAGQLTTYTDQAGRVTSYSYDSQGDLVGTDGPAGTSTSSHDHYGRLTASTNALGATSAVTYDADGRPTSTATGEAAIATEYDLRGNPTTVTDPTGRITRYTYDLLDRVTSTIEPGDVTTTTEYDAVGRPVRVVDPAGTTTSTFTAAGRPLTEVGPTGTLMTYTYDAAGNQVAATTGTGRITRTTYDPNRRVTAVTSPSGLVTRYGYDAAGRTVRITDPAGRVSTTTYTPRGEIATVTRPGGAVQRFSYTALGYLATATNANNDTTRYGYDEAGNMNSVTDPLGRTTRFEHDAAGRETAIIDPLGRTTTTAYDDRGNPTIVTRPDGSTQTTNYDPADRILARTGSDGTTVTTAYDSAGRVATVADTSGSYAHAYDTAGRLSTVAQPDGRSIAYGYDAAGRRTALTYPDSGTATFTYDPDGYLTRLVDQNGNATSYNVDADGRLTRAVLPGGVTRTYAYTAGELSWYVETRGSTITSTTLTRDPSGRISSEKTGSATRTYHYDTAGQLVRATGQPTGTSTFGYDAAGNRTRIIRGSTTTTTLTYDAADQLTQTRTGPATDPATVSYGYDTSGNLTGITGDGQTLAASYDDLGRLTTATTGAGTLASRYDLTHAPGDLVATVKTTRGDVFDQRAYTWSDDAIPQVLRQDGIAAANFTYGYDRVAAVTAATSTPFSVDYAGSTQRTSSTTAWAQATSYDALGLPADASAVAPTFGYRGELAVGSAVYLRDRVYDATVGRFTSQDPLDGLAGAVGANNPYPYGFNDPVNHVDPTGRRATSDASYELASYTRPSTGECPSFGGRHRQDKCFQGVLLRTRGYVAIAESLRASQPALNTLWNTGRRERAAQMFTINELNQRRLTLGDRAGGILPWNIPVASGMDWEVGPPRGWRIDIVTDEASIFEVKWYAEANRVLVEQQLIRYVNSARFLGIGFAPSTELTTWADGFPVTKGLFGGKDHVFVWGESADPIGAVWFNTSERTPRNVRNTAYPKIQQREWGNIGIPLPVRFPVPVPVGR